MTKQLAGPNGTRLAFLQTKSARFDVCWISAFARGFATVHYRVEGKMKSENVHTSSITHLRYRD